MPKPVICAICDTKIPYGTIHSDLDHPQSAHSTMRSAAAGRDVWHVPTGETPILERSQITKRDQYR